MRRPPAESPRLLYQAPAHRTFELKLHAYLVVADTGVTETP